MKSGESFSNVLLIHPFDNPTLRRTAELLSRKTAKITLFSMIPEAEEKNELEDYIQKLVMEDHRKSLERIAAPLEKNGLETQVRVVVGNSFLDIIRQVIAAKHDMVVMMADGPKTIREQLFGSTSMHMMRKCPCPVWVVKPSRRTRLRKVMAAVDPEPENPKRNQLNAGILQHAKYISEKAGAELHVVHAWNVFGGNVDRSRRWVNKTEVRMYVEQAANEHRQRLDQLLTETEIKTTNIHLVQGKPGEVIPKMSAELGVDLLVMGTVCRTGIPGFFIGNTAETVLGQVDCSVLTIKPEDFVTPVKIAG